MISVLIPWRETSPDRRRIFDWVLSRCRALLPGADISVADSGHEDFNRGASINLAATEAKGDSLLILDADTFFHAAQINKAVALAQMYGTWVLPYDVYLNLDDVTTARLLDGDPTADVATADVGTEFRLTDSVSGLIVVTRAGFEQVGGFDEHFRGWGFEDRAFESAANTLIGPCVRLPGPCFHLAHPTSARFEQPEIEFNRLRAHEYKRLEGNHQAMRALVGS